MKHYFLFLIIAIISACSSPIQKKEVPEQITPKKIEVYPWSCFAEEIKADFSKDTIAIIEKYRKEADSLISDTDIYELMGQTIFPKDAKQLPDSMLTILQQETYSFNRDSNYDELNKLYPKYISKTDVLFLFSQITCKSYFWDEVKLKNVKCAKTIDLKEIFKAYDSSKYENFRTYNEFCYRKFITKYHSKRLKNYSKPIFNKAKTIAFISRINKDSGELLIFKRKKGRWRKIATECLWIS